LDVVREVLGIVIESKTGSKAVYPSQYETKVLFRDGSSIFLRLIREDDAERCLTFVGRPGIFRETLS
jgi:hypothetical protein